MTHLSKPLNFGRFKGREIRELPSSYLQFMRKRFGASTNSWSEKWRKGAVAELKRRKVPERSVQFSNWSINAFSKMIGNNKNATLQKVSKRQYVPKAVRTSLEKTLTSFQPTLTVFGKTCGIVDFMELVFHEAIECGLINKIPGEKAMYMVIHNQLMWKYIKVEELTKGGEKIHDVLSLTTTAEATDIMRKKLNES